MAFKMGNASAVCMKRGIGILLILNAFLTITE